MRHLWLIEVVHYHLVHRKVIIILVVRLEIVLGVHLVMVVVEILVVGSR